MICVGCGKKAIFFGGVHVNYPFIKGRVCNRCYDLIDTSEAMRIYEEGKCILRLAPHPISHILIITLLAILGCIIGSVILGVRP